MILLAFLTDLVKKLEQMMSLCDRLMLTAPLLRCVGFTVIPVRKLPYKD